MRKLIIDTDTASDDAVAIIMALRAKNIMVEAITVVAGNVPLEIAINNALISVEKANTYGVPVFAGEDKPLNRKLVTGQFAHGQNGMGDIELSTPKKIVENKNAVDALLEIINNNPNEIELIAIGPLTNIAKAIQKDKEIMKKLKAIYVMGGNGFGCGNITDYAEFNFYVDAEAVKIVSDLGIKITLLPWNTCLSGVYLNKEDILRLNSIDNKLGKFSVNINSALVRFNIKHFGTEGFVLADPGIVAIAIDPSIATEIQDVNSSIVTEDGALYGYQYITSTQNSNYAICTKMDKDNFMNLMINLLS